MENNENNEAIDIAVNDVPAGIEDIMHSAYLQYSLSVNVGRAIPDVRDGLKPVHRRILYAMKQLGLTKGHAYTKCAKVVGEVIGNYHPHGDQAVYDTMVRMAQDFSMRRPLVDGQGNFGSIDGDSAAAYRYTECRLERLAEELLADMDRNTVDMRTTFDEVGSEPVVLPARYPNLLVNGATGIAVGMSTNIPPHNLGEVVDALVHILSNWAKRDDIGVDDLMTFIKGPDFPTGGIIIGSDNEEEGLSSAYGTGRGKVTTQAKAHIEDMGRGRQMIIVTELPYLTNKSSLIEKIAKLARAGALDGISDLRDESDRQGMRIVIELSKNADPAEIWGTTTSYGYGVEGTGWRLTEQLDTYVGAWTLKATTAMTSLLIDAGPGDTLFDVVSGSIETPGSSDGLPFTSAFVTGLPGTWVVDYFGPVSVTPNAAAGDLYRYMLITPDVGWTGELTFMIACAAEDHGQRIVLTRDLDRLVELPLAD